MRLAMNTRFAPFSPAIVALVLFPACAGLKPPVQSTGPAVSPEGVQLAVKRQGCTQVSEPDFPGNDLIEEILEIQVGNLTATSLTVRPGAFRLVTAEGAALETVTWRAQDPLTIQGGDTRAFELRFMTRGGLECAREMRLEANAGLILRGGPVKLGAIRFVPSRAL
jgi:hypothetical protein